MILHKIFNQSPNSIWTQRAEPYNTSVNDIVVFNTKNGKKFGYVEWMDAFFDPTNIDYKVIDKCIVEGKYTLEKNLHDITSFHENIFNSHLDKIKLGKDSVGYKTSFNFIEEYFSREVIKI